MLAVKEDETGFYRFRMSKRDTSGVFSQLVEAGAALDLQDKVSYSNNGGIDNFVELGEVESCTQRSSH